MKGVLEYTVENHGARCGADAPWSTTEGTDHTACYLGRGEDAAAALDMAIRRAATDGWCIKSIINELSEQNDFSLIEKFDGVPMHHYVTLFITEAPAHVYNDPEEGEMTMWTAVWGWWSGELHSGIRCSTHFGGGPTVGYDLRSWSLGSIRYVHESGFIELRFLCFLLTIWL